MDFEKAIKRVLGHEVGYVNDPEDPGGETKWGISKRSYPDLDIAALTRDHAIAIYERDFWERIHHRVLPDALDFQLLDSAVHSGIEQSIRFLQRALHVADDGYFGPVSRQALQTAEVNDLAFNFIAERIDFMTRRKNWDAHGKGWMRRMAQNLRYAAEDN